MPKSMVGLLAAVGATMFALAPSAHGVLFLLDHRDGCRCHGSSCLRRAMSQPRLLAVAFRQLAREQKKRPRCPFYAPFRCTWVVDPQRDVLAWLAYNATYLRG